MYGIAGLLTGRTLCGRYRIDAVIGRGGMGAVYRAADERLGRAVALKVIGITAADPVEHQRLQARFLREARAAAALRHANVVSVHDFGSDPELALDFLVMELLHGEDLASRLLRAGPPPLHVSLEILRQAARGLAAGHRAGLVHRDVKPGNLFLEDGDDPDRPHVRVLDFGIAQVSEEEGTVTQLTEFGRAPFSPAYASPEQMRGDERLTPASDVFSLGAVGYNLLTGVRPFTSADSARMVMETAEAVRALPERAPHLPPHVRQALTRALSIHPAQRFAHAGEMAESLEGGARAAPAPAAAAAPAPAPPPARTERRLFGAVSVEPDEGTRVLTDPRAGRRRARERTVLPAAVPAHGATAAPPAFAPAEAQPIVAAPAIPPRDWTGERAMGPVRRVLGGVWSFIVTTGVMALFVGAWALAVNGVFQARMDQVYAGAAASILLTPLAVHRLTGGRGRYRFGVFGSIVATAAAVYYVGRDSDPAIVLTAVFGLQVVTSFVLARLTRRRIVPPSYAGLP